MLVSQNSSRFVERKKELNLYMEPLKIGDKVPEFKGINQEGKVISNLDFKGRKLVLYFYPKENTPGCTAEACNLKENYSDLKSKGYDILGVSADSESSHRKFIEKYSLPFDLLADEDKTILKSFGAWGMKFNYGKEYEGIIRTTYIISEEGIIQDIIKKVDTKDHTNQILKRSDQ